MISFFSINMPVLTENVVSKRILKKSPIKTEFGKAVRSFRVAQHLSQEKLAELADLHTNYIGSVERGERNVTLENICKIAKGLNTHPADIFKKIHNPFCFGED